MRNRRVEYYSASVMVGWAMVLALPGNTITEGGAYSSFLQRGWTEVGLAVVLTVVGTLWLGALWVNGHHRRSPVARCVAAVAGVSMWGHVTFLLVQHALYTGVWSVDVATYGLLTAFDMFSCSRSAADAYEAHVVGRLRDELAGKHDT